MRTIEVALGARSYPVHIGAGLLERADDLLAPYARGGRMVLVSDENVWALQGGRLNLKVEPILLPPVRSDCHGKICGAETARWLNATVPHDRTGGC